MKPILSLEKAEYGSIESVGGKAASLGNMLKAGFPVPPGFVITTEAYKKGGSAELTTQILAAFDELGVERVAVRSSAVAEDSSEASWAGQLDTVLNANRDTLIEAVEYCWKSMKSKRAQSYAKDRNIPKHQQTVAVVIQKMVDSDISGVMFTANPINNNTHETLVEVIYGLGELLVQGTVTPESYTLNDTGETIKYTRHRQTKKLVYLKGSNQEVNLKAANEPILSKQQLKDIFKQGKRIEKHYGKPQDIEFTFENNKLFIVQSRPITTLGKKSFGLPEFFSRCVKTLARPATLQRDEIVRFTANAVSAMRVVTLPLEGTTRAYYFEKDDAKKLLQICLKNVASSSQLENHLKAYEALKAQREKTCELIEQKPDNYSVIFKQYKEFLTKLSPFLYTGVAVDAILFPKLKEIVEQEYPKEHIRILDIVSTPKTFHDYQKFRLALCELKISQGSESEIEEVATTYAHVNEYSFVETLLTTAKVRAELGQLTYLTAQAEIEDIKKSIDNKAASIKWLEKTLPEPLATQAKLIKEYSLLRTDRIDQLKKVQTKLRVTFEQLAKDMSKKDGKPWSRSHIANLLDREIDGFVSKGNTPSFDEVHKRLDQKYLYYYMNNTANVLTDSQIVKRARDIVITPETSKPDSLISVGTTAFPGMVSGRVVRITDLKDLSKVQKGDIMVAHVTMPDYTPAMKVAVGFITAQGGVTSHAAIVARELGKPCIVGADNCMDVLKDGDYILLDASNQIVTLVQKAKGEYLGEPDELFYWGPSAASPLYMSDFIEAVDRFFTSLSKDPTLPHPPKTLALFYKGKVVWLINAQAFSNFTQDLFIAYKKRNKLSEDVNNWKKSASDTNDLIPAWRQTLFAEFSLYGAESVLAKNLFRFDDKSRQEIWGAFTVPDNSTFLSRIDNELLDSRDLLVLAKKYPWIQDGYDGVSGNAEEYFKKRLKILTGTGRSRTEVKKDRLKLARELNLSKDEVSALNLTRGLAEFMDERKAWMMQTRRLIKDRAVKFKYGWLFDDGKSSALTEDAANELWERYVEFKASSNAVTGLVASNGGRHFINGEARIISSPTDSVADDRILVVPSTSPSYVPLMRKARALITDHGGMMSHAAIVAREFGLPCIVGTKQATKVLKDGDKVVLDLVKGEVNR